MTFQIRRMTEKEVCFAINWARKEGWNPGLNDTECFFAADPSGFFIGLLDDKPIATGSAVAYDDHFGFCGLYIVKSEHRKHGYGIELTHARLNYLGNRIIGIDGVLGNVSKYERIGYVQAHLNQRFELKTIPSVILHPHVEPLQTVPFQQLLTFDRRYFPAPRKAFLEKWISQPESYALGFVENSLLSGYGVIRKCYEGYKIGPLFANSQFVAKALFESLCSKIEKGPVYLDAPQPNENCQKLVKEYRMTPGFEVVRMYKNGSPTIDLSGIYGITTFELG